MALKFRLKGLAETFIDHIQCPGCGKCDSDDTSFSTEYTRVTFEGIIVVVQCQVCAEIFVPDRQRCGIIDSKELRKAVEKDAQENEEPLLSGLEAVLLSAERMNAMRKGELH
ncbi:MAG: hypothetical protein H6619_06100 [Deltaproteobacteria bacterium]|nr:hypothetical protein [Deltaproteobacteria bacterium]